MGKQESLNEPGPFSTPCIGDGRTSTFNDGNPYNGALETPTIGLMTIPYYMEIMGV